MGFEIECERPYRRTEPESLRTNLKKYVPSNIESLYSQKKIDSILDNHAKIFVPYTAECEYPLDFRNKNKDEAWGIASIYHSTQVKKHKK